MKDSDSPGVLDLLRRRRDGQSDDFVVALALEGGGMRGVVSGAMLLALRDLGIASLFDRYYGTSSGSINLAYYAAGGGWDALSVYYDHLISGFVRRPPRPGHPMIDMGRVEQIVKREVPLDADALAGSDADVRILLTDVAERRPLVVEARKQSGSIVPYLLASAWLPILAGRPYVLDGRDYLDGGLVWPDPLYGALAEGCTHVLMLNTAPAGTASRTSRTSARVLTTVLDRWSPGLGGAYLDGRRQWTTDRAHIGVGREVVLRGTRILRVQPGSGAHGVERLTLDRATLLDGARAGYATIRSAFGRPMTGSFFAVVDG